MSRLDTKLIASLIYYLHMIVTINNICLKLYEISHTRHVYSSRPIPTFRLAKCAAIHFVTKYIWIAFATCTQRHTHRSK